MMAKQKAAAAAATVTDDDEAVNGLVNRSPRRAASRSPAHSSPRRASSASSPSRQLPDSGMI